jgi:hypothetical protein
VLIITFVVADTLIVNSGDFSVGLFSPQHFNVSGNYLWINSTYGCGRYKENITLTQDKICLVQRGICTFIEKTLFAQNANCSMIVIYERGGNLICMDGDSSGLHIPAVYMNNLQKYTRSMNDTLCFEFNGYHYSENNSLLLMLVMTCGITLFVSFVAFVCGRLWYRMTRMTRITRVARVSTPSVNIDNYVVPIQPEHLSNGNSCAICLEESNEETRLLDDLQFVKLNGCTHIFHKKCITQAFNKWDYKCPICRKTVEKILIPINSPLSDVGQV